MRQFKIKVPDDFAFKILLKFNTLEYTEQQVSNVLSFFNKYDMEEHNIILEVVCFGIPEIEVAFKYSVEVDYVNSLVAAFYWKLSRRLGSTTNLFVTNDSQEVSCTTEQTLTEWDSIRDLLEAGLIVDREYKAILDAGYSSMSELKRDFDEDRFGLFQKRIRGLSSNSISNIIQVCLT